MIPTPTRPIYFHFAYSKARREFAIVHIGEAIDYDKAKRNAEAEDDRAWDNFQAIGLGTSESFAREMRDWLIELDIVGSEATVIIRHFGKQTMELLDDIATTRGWRKRP